MLTLDAGADTIVLKELIAFDSAKSRKAREEIYGFHIGLRLETSVKELMHPKPLPRGKLDIEHLSIAFKKYPHVFHDLGAELTINDTALMLRNFNGPCGQQ